MSGVGLDVVPGLLELAEGRRFDRMEAAEPSNMTSPGVPGDSFLLFSSKLGFLFLNMC